MIFNLIILYIGVEHRLVGCISYTPVIEDDLREDDVLALGRSLYIDWLSAKESFQRCGIGRYLLETVKSQMKADNFDAIWLFSYEEAVRFYERNGK